MVVLSKKMVGPRQGLTLFIKLLSSPDWRTAGFISPLRCEMGQSRGSYTSKTKLLRNLFFCCKKYLNASITNFLQQKNLPVS